ncbi:MAG: DUF2480 family protein [Saprospiraceae bacterium]|nr:DUF2480 family protein [Saprospiraceae bacterium]MDZ4705914.1 DUF2480 family protein [Saprospiraceae bacterium]
MNADTEKPLVNRVVSSSLITINLEDFFPKAEVVPFDLKQYLFMELIVKEKDFREAIQQHDWTQYQGKVLLVFCSADAIIPMWAYMLVAASAAPYAADIFQGDAEAYYKTAFAKALDALDPAGYDQKRIVIKGCSDKPVPAAAYIEITRKLQPYAQSIMYGEPCSTVPIFKRPRKLE